MKQRLISDMDRTYWSVWRLLACVALGGVGLAALVFVVRPNAHAHIWSLLLYDDAVARRTHWAWWCAIVYTRWELVVNFLLRKFLVRLVPFLVFRFLFEEQVPTALVGYALFGTTATFVVVLVLSGLRIHVARRGADEVAESSSSRRDPPSRGDDGRDVASTSSAGYLATECSPADGSAKEGASLLLPLAEAAGGDLAASDSRRARGADGAHRAALWALFLEMVLVALELVASSMLGMSPVPLGVSVLFQSVDAFVCFVAPALLFAGAWKGWFGWRVEMLELGLQAVGDAAAAR